MEENGVQYTTYDRLLRAWENSTELVRDFQRYSQKVEETEVKELFEQFAEDEGIHASKLRELVIKYQKQ